jgi:hypothetical protein
MHTLSTAVLYTARHNYCKVVVGFHGVMYARAVTLVEAQHIATIITLWYHIKETACVLSFGDCIRVMFVD